MNLNPGSGKRDSAKRVRFSPASARNNADSSRSHRADYVTDEYNSDDNDALEADVSSNKRKGRQINMDGYGSEDSDQDSITNLSDYSDDEDEANNSDNETNIPATQQPDEQADGSDVDMFSDSATVSSKPNNVEKKKKRKRYLDISEIQGQEMDSQSRVESRDAGLKDRKGKRTEVSWDNSDVDDSNDEGRVRIEAFNMKDDLEEGQFDAQGNFVWNKKDPQQHQDIWLQGISKTAITQARESAATRESQQTNNQRLANRWQTLSNDDIILGIINQLQPGETILNALARIGGKPKKKNNKNKNKWSKKNSVDAKKEAERRQGIEILTEFADQMMARGVINIYDETFEQFVRQMRVAGRIADDWAVGSPLATPAMPLTMQTGLDVEENDAGGLLDDLDELE
ncbi:hypothetical protein IWW45_007613 [Coemansia sp. RSA 485]|nr:hypothetical protein IWW45_007613 [Coemansia sp. RSA 485]